MIFNSGSGVRSRRLLTFLTQLCWLLIFYYIAIDAVNGFFIQSVGIKLPFSLAYKLIVLSLCLLLVLVYSLPIGLGLLMVFSFLIFKPIYVLATEHTHFVMNYDFPLGIKILLTIVIYTFCQFSFKHNPEMSYRYGRGCLILGFWVVTLNVLSGYFGFGYPTYSNSNIGFKGYFVAGNELSALFIVLSTFFLYECWKKKTRKVYLLCSLLVLITGVSIGTKTGILLSFITPILVPMFNSKGQLLTINRLAILTVIILLITVSIVASYNILLENPIFSKVVYNLESLGIIGAIFSGRHLWVMNIFNHVDDSLGVWSLIIGLNSGDIFNIIGKPTVEIDPLDVAIYFGMPFSLMCIFWSLVIVWKSYVKLKVSYYAPAVLIANGLLLLMAFVAGHVWTSGMLSIAWGVLNGFIVLNKMNPVKDGNVDIRSESDL